jgi:Domain of unknown function (DUF4296)
MLHLLLHKNYQYQLMKFVFSICIILLFGACNNSTPKGILPFEKMQAVFWDQLKAESYTKENLQLDSIKNKNLGVENSKIQMQIFEKHQTTKEIFYNSYIYYLNNDKLFADLLDSVISAQTRANFEEMKIRYNPPSKNTYNLFLKELFIKKPEYNINPAIHKLSIEE